LRSAELNFRKEARMHPYRAIELVTVLAVIEAWLFGFQVGRARQRFEVPAPATTGHPVFERYNRVHQNTLEQLIVFLPLIWVFALYVNVRGATVLGFLFIIARAIYAVGYVKDPGRRVAGATLTFLVLAVLAVGSVTGVVGAMLSP
jgi:glutathione S-transferase